MTRTPRLICYPTSGKAPEIRPARQHRVWMDGTPDGYAYRCLPLTIANSHGWEVLADQDHEAIWSGGPHRDDITVRSAGATDAAVRLTSHFGAGVITFDLGCLFRTDPELNLWVSGPVNAAKDAIAPLTGIVETDWAPYTFTMNWQFTRKNQLVRFQKGEPVCVIFPLMRGLIESVAPEIRALDDDPDFRDDYVAWRDGRAAFLKDLPQPGSAANQSKWQKAYFRGKLPDGSAGTATHQTKLQLKPFAARGTPAAAKPRG